VAALGVVAYHYLDKPAYYGLLGVELFFVISGFVILMTLERIPSLPQFAVGRIARLYPAYWLSLAVAGLFLWTNGQTSGWTVLLNATMLQAFLYAPNVINPYWTLAYELVFYAAMAVIFAANRLRNVDVVAVAWLILMMLFRGTILLTGRGSGLYGDWMLQSLLMPQFGHLFIAGMMLYRIDTGRATIWTSLALALSVLYSLFGRPDWAQIGPLLYFSVNAAFIAAVWAASSDRAPVFATPLLAGLGVCSYSLYLLHLPVKMVLSHLFGQLSGQLWFVILVLFPAAVGAAFLSRRYIEIPGQLLMKKLAARARPKPVEA
jgi:peptidoglycan/LPS O-acetylase OafA/YrhL